MERTVRGLSLIEVVVSTGILFLVMVLLLNLLSTSIRGTSAAEKRLIAEGLAWSALEQARSRPYGSLEAGSTESSTEEFEGAKYLIFLQVREVPGHSLQDLKSINTRISWNGIQGREVIELTGYVTPLLR